MTIKAITLYQPWASLVAHGFKTLETRSWGTPFTGVLAIHAGAGAPRWDLMSYEAHELARKLLRTLDLDADARLPRSALIAYARLMPVLQIDGASRMGALVAEIDGQGVNRGGGWAQQALLGLHWKQGKERQRGTIGFGEGTRRIFRHESLLGDLSMGRWAWPLEGVVRFDPVIPCRGHQGLWTVPFDVEQWTGHAMLECVRALGGPI